MCPRGEYSSGGEHRTHVERGGVGELVRPAGSILREAKVPPRGLDRAAGGTGSRAAAPSGHSAGVGTLTPGVTSHDVSLPSCRSSLGALVTEVIQPQMARISCLLPLAGCGYAPFTARAAVRFRQNAMFSHGMTGGGHR